MSSILRIGTDLGMDELHALASSHQSASVVLGNTEQAVPLQGIISRKVIRARLENMARACGKLRSYGEIRISGDADVANAVFSDKKVRSRLNTWVVRSTDTLRIQAEIANLDFANVDRLLVSSEIAESFLRRRLASETVIEREDSSQRVVDAIQTSPAPTGRLVWAGSSDPNDGLQDFCRIAALTDLLAQVVWTRMPNPAEFTSVVSSMSMLGLENRLDFAVPGTFESFERQARRSSHDGSLWLCTARDYPSRSAFELLATLGAPIVAFDSMYARGLAERYPATIRLVPEGGVLEAVDHILKRSEAVA